MERKKGVRERENEQVSEGGGDKKGKIIRMTERKHTGFTRN